MKTTPPHGHSRAPISVLIICFFLGAFPGPLSANGIFPDFSASQGYWPDTKGPDGGVFAATDSGFVAVDTLDWRTDLPNSEFFTEEEIARQAWRNSGTVTYVYDLNRELVSARRIYDSGGLLWGYAPTKESLFIGKKFTGVETVLLNIANDGHLMWSAPIEGPVSNPNIIFIEPLDDGGAVVIAGQFFKNPLGTNDPADSEKGMFVARVSADGQLLWAQGISPLPEGSEYGKILEFGINESDQFFVLALFQSVDRSARIAGNGGGTMESLFDLDTGELVSAKGPHLFPGKYFNYWYSTPARTLFGERIWLTDGGLWKSGPEGEFVDFNKTLLRDMAREVRPVNRANPSDLQMASGTATYLSNGDMLVVLGTQTPRELGRVPMRYIGLVTRDGTLQSVERFKYHSFSLDSAERIVLAKDKREIVPDVILGDFVRVADLPNLERRKITYERTKGPFSGLEEINGAWRRHSDLGWVALFEAGWYYSQRLDAILWTDPSAPASNFWAFNSITGDWLFITVSRNGLIYNAKTDAWSNIN